MRMARSCWGLILAVLLILGAQPAAAAANPFQTPPPFKSAIIKYQYTGTQSGDSTVYFRGPVRAEHKRVSTKIMGISSETHQITITEPKRITTVDLKAHKASYTGNYLSYLAREYDKLSPAEQKRVMKNAEAMGRNFAGMMGGKPQIKKGTYLNRPVDIVTVMGLTTYTWRGKHVTLKQQGSIMGMSMNMRAVDIKTGVPVPADKLRVPPGIKAVFDQQADQRQRETARRIMAMLKDPNFGKGAGGAPPAAAAGRPPQAPPAKPVPAPANHGGGQDDTVQQGLKTLKKIFNW